MYLIAFSKLQKIDFLRRLFIGKTCMKKMMVSKQVLSFLIVLLAFYQFVIAQDSSFEEEFRKLNQRLDFLEKQSKNYIELRDALDSFGVDFPEQSFEFRRKFPYFLKVFRQGYSEEYFQAQEAFSKLNSKCKKVVPLLAENIYDENFYVRSMMLVGLENIGGKETILPLIEMAKKDREIQFRVKALNALCQVMPSENFVSILIELLEESNEWVFLKYVVKHLGILGAEAKIAIPALIAILKSSNEKEDKEEPLNILFKNDKRIFRYFCAKALGNIVLESQENVSILLKIFEDEKAEIRYGAIEAVKEKGVLTEAIKEGLDKLLISESNKEIKELATEILNTFLKKE